MSGPSIGKTASYGLQAVCYAAFMTVVGYFSTSPAYKHLPPGDAVVKLSFQHAGQRKEACRERSAEELANRCSRSWLLRPDSPRTARRRSIAALPFPPASTVLLRA